MVTRASFWIAAAAAVAAAICGARAAERERPIDEWYRGPVRYLIKRAEEKEFKSLTTDAARLLFIRDFWRNRDPNATTPENEARMAFWSRVAEANTLFHESTRPGWLTDRGRIHILLGPPNDVQQDNNFRIPNRPDLPPGLLRWIYHSREPGRKQDANFVVAFVQDLSGEWRLSDDARISSIHFDPYSPLNSVEVARLYPRLQSAIESTQPSNLSVMMDLGRAVEPADETSLLDTVSAETFLGSVPVGARWDFYPGTGDGRSLAVVTLYVPADAAGETGRGTPALLALGRLESGSGTRVDLGEGTFTRAEDGDGTRRDILLYQARTLVAPGVWSYYAGVFDASGLRAGKAAGDVDVPAFTGAAAISSLTPAATVAPVTRSADVGWAQPFILGDLRVIPRQAAAFPRSGDFAVYFQIDPPRQPPGTTLELRFFRRAGDTLVPAGTPQVTSDIPPAQALSFPLKDWPPGPYRLTVTLRTASGETLSSRSMDFEVTTEAR